MPKYSSISLEDAKIIERRFWLIAGAALITVLVGSVIFMELEKVAFIDALYFSVVSLLTVGYGDITPHTTPGKIFVMVYLVAGIGIMAVFVETLLRHAVGTRVKRRYQRKAAKKAKQELKKEN
jgi:voltage-gated potassium channel Kch